MINPQISTWLCWSMTGLIYMKKLPKQFCLKRPWWHTCCCQHETRNKVLINEESNSFIWRWWTGLGAANKGSRCFATFNKNSCRSELVGLSNEVESCRRGSSLLTKTTDQRLINLSKKVPENVKSSDSRCRQWGVLPQVQEVQFDQFIESFSDAETPHNIYILADRILQAWQLFDHFILSYRNGRNGQYGITK